MTGVGVGERWHLRLVDRLESYSYTKPKGGGGGEFQRPPRDRLPHANQLTGAPHSAELIAFINDAVNWDEQPICGGTVYSNLSGWYLKLYANEPAGLEYDPTMADVHTQPTDAGGNDVGRILHVGTGMSRLMVVTAETCSGPKAYAGLAFSYGELITEDWERLNDNKWDQRIQSGFPDVPWMSSVAVNKSAPGLGAGRAAREEPLRATVSQADRIIVA